MMKLSISKYRFIPVFMVLLTVLFNENTLIVATSLSSSSYAFISLGIYFAIFFLLSIQTGVTSINGKIMGYIAVSCLFILITTIATWDFHINHALITFEIIQAAIVMHFVSYKDYTRLYVKIMSSIAAFSLVMHILTSAVPVILSFARVVYNSQNVRFYSFFLYFRSTNEGFRNYGFLSEPGDYQHYLNLALLLYLYFFPEDEKRKWIPVILTITVLTTFSPAGMVVCALIWISYTLAYSKNLRRTIYSILGILLLLVLVFSIESLRDRMLDYTVSKLTGAKSNSLGSRISGITTGLECFLNSPIWGNGFTKGTEMMRQIMLSEGFGYNQTSTTSAYLAFFGLPLALMFTVPYIKAFIPQNRISKIAIFVLIGATLVTINNERYVWDLPYYVFMMYGAKRLLLSNEDRDGVQINE